MELTIAVVLIGLFSVISLPLLTAGGERDLQYAARRLSATVKYLFNEAALSGKEHRLICDLDGNSYRARLLEPDGQLKDVEGLAKGAVLKGGIDVLRLKLEGQGSFNRGEVTLHIDPSGWMEHAIVVLENTRGQMLSLDFNPFTGTAEVFEGERSSRSVLSAIPIASGDPALPGKADSPCSK